FGASDVVFGQCANEPRIGIVDLQHGSRICRPNLIQQLMQRPCISFPIHFHECALCFCPEIVWLDSQYAIELRFLFSITSEDCVAVSDLIEIADVAWVQLNYPLEISYGLFPASLTPLNVTGQLEHPWIIGQCPPGNLEFSQSAVVIAVSII